MKKQKIAMEFSSGSFQKNIYIWMQQLILKATETIHGIMFIPQNATHQCIFFSILINYI